MTRTVESSKTTPAPTKRDESALRLVVEPATRTMRWLHTDPTTVGNMLDAPPHVCAVRIRSYNRDTGTSWMVPYPCGKRSCSGCVVEYIVKRVAPAWAYWRGFADRFEYDDSYQRTRDGFTTRGPNARPGVLLLPGKGEEERIVYAPGSALRGNDLNSVLVQDIRAVPLDNARARTRMPTDASRVVPGRIADDEYVAIARECGIRYARRGRGRVADDVTPEQWAELGERLGVA
jgi:hypothetical protein